MSKQKADNLTTEDRIDFCTYTHEDLTFSTATRFVKTLTGMHKTVESLFFSQCKIACFARRICDCPHIFIFIYSFIYFLKIGD